MSCSTERDSGTAAYLKTIAERTRRDRVPLSGFFDLTYRCNFRCSHCYVGHRVAQHQSASAELGLDQMVALLTAAAEGGCLFVTFSGGEPLIREDFTGIYAAARRLGMLVTVFTNASLVTQAHVDAFREYPPRAIEVSIYGTSEATYERVTGRPGSFHRVMAGLERLLDAGLRVRLKAMILRDTVDELPDVEAMATRLGLEFRVDPLVIPRLDGDTSPLAQRVDAELAVHAEMDSEYRLRVEADFFERQRGSIAAAGVPAERLFLCGAGISSFHMDPHGYMRPCLLTLSMAYNVLDMGFLQAWKCVTAAVDGAVAMGPRKCSGCELLDICGYCPGLFALEDPEEQRPSEYVCRLGETRRKAIESFLEGNGA